MWTAEFGAAVGRGRRASWATYSAQTPAAGDGGQGAGRYAGRRAHADEESRSGDGGGGWVLTGSAVHLAYQSYKMRQYNFSTNIC
jgi:hypothetical protein